MNAYRLTATKIGEKFFLFILFELTDVHDVFLCTINAVDTFDNRQPLFCRPCNVIGVLTFGHQVLPAKTSQTYERDRANFVLTFDCLVCAKTTTELTVHRTGENNNS